MHSALKSSDWSVIAYAAATASVIDGQVLMHIMTNASSISSFIEDFPLSWKRSIC